MSGVKPGPVGDLYLVVGWLSFLWVIFIVDVVLRMTSGIWIAHWLGLRPRNFDGLVGIVTSHLLHANLSHIVANSVSLLILGWVACGYSRALTSAAVGYSMLIAGLFTWCFGSLSAPGAVHVGASGIIFGLIGWLIANGIFRRGWFPLFLGIIILVLYGGALLGVLPPQVDENGKVAPISWEMHLGGLVGGIMASWHLRKTKA
jgi:membrane associated rhomboid family serine protease